MTDRYNVLVVVLNKDIREDDAEHTINAIRMIKNVLSVTPNISDIGTHIAEMRASQKLEAKLRDVLYPK